MTDTGRCIILTGERQGDQIELTPGETFIGDSDHCHVRLGDLGVNRECHGVWATIAFDGGQYRLQVNDPAVPVWLNDQLAAAEASLKHRDVIGFGGQPRAVEFRWSPATSQVPALGGNGDKEVEDAADIVPAPPPRRLTLVIPRQLATWIKVLAIILGVILLIVSEVKIHRALSDLSAQVRHQGQALSSLQSEVEQIQRDIQSTKASLEGESGLIGRIAVTYSPSVCLIEGTYQFIERGTGKVLREAQTPDAGITIFEGETKFQVTIEGTGPRIEETVIGTGFLIGRGLILTNLHVVRPWWKDEAAEQILGHGFLPRMLALNAYFPSVSGPFRLEIIGASENYDLAVCRFNQGSLSVPTPSLAGNEVQPQVGQSVVLLGYPAGVEALLARLDENVARDIVSSTSLRVPEVARELASRGLIRPLPTQGHITALLPTRIIHDAATTTGGSGGPLFNKDGLVIGINYAVFTEFSASNFAVPIGIIRDFLRQQGISL